MRVLALCTAAAVAAGLVAVTAAPASAVADVGVELPMTNVRDVLVDDAHGHVLLVGGGSNGIVVRTLEGAAVTTIDGQFGATSMVASADGSTVYVALSAADAISAIDTATLTEKARYATGASTCPTSLAFAGTQLWFGYGCSAGSGNIGLLDLAAETPAVALGKAPDTLHLYSAPLLAGSPADAAHLLAAVTGLSPATLHSLAVSGTTIATNVSRQVGSDVADMSVSPDGKDVITASGSPYEHPRYHVADLANAGVYTTDAYPNAVTQSAAGYVAAGISGAYEPDVYVFSAGGTLRRKYELDGCCASNAIHYLLGGTLAFSADGARLYATSRTSTYTAGQPDRIWLHVLHDPTKAPSAITLTKPASAKVRVAYTLTGSLTSTLAIPAGAVLKVQRASTYGTVNLPSVTTGSGGSFSIPDKVGKRGTYTYTVSWAGDADHAATAKSIGLRVLGLTPSLTVTTDKTAYDYRQSARVVAHLGTTSTNRSLAITAKPLDVSARGVVSGKVDSSGYLRGSYALTWRTTFTAAFAGDDVYEPRRVSVTVRVHPRVTQALSGYYGTSNGYRLYRTSKDPVITTTVAPAVYGCVTMVAQRYDGGSWTTIPADACIGAVDGRAVATLAGSPPAGTRYRIRSTYQANSYLLSKGTAYQYLRFTT